MSWTVNFTSKAAKQAGKLPKRERDILALLVRDDNYAEQPSPTGIITQNSVLQLTTAT